MAGRVEGKVAVITGTGSGQGRTAALRFAAEGAKVLGCDIDEEAATETVRLVRESGGEMECLYLDLTDEANVHALMEHAAATYGGIDILYNNIFRQVLAPVEHLPVDTFNFMVASVLTTYWTTVKHAIPHFRKRGSGAVVNIASISGMLHGMGSGFVGNTGATFTYAILKAAVLRMTTALAVDLSPLQVRVNAVSPGPINVPATAPVHGTEDAPLYAPMLGSLLSHRFGEPEDVVNAALFLASDEASWITGANLVVDGGWTASGGLGRPDPAVRDLVNEQYGHFFDLDTSWDTAGERAPASELPRDVGRGGGLHQR
jgi:NAD(P)-dependent dehydrogenase (short-subunit alcohol dehydrogenase family)